MRKIDGMTDDEVLHACAIILIFDLHAVVELDDESDLAMHGIVQDLQASRRLDVTMHILVQADHCLITDLPPSVVRHHFKLSLFNLSSDS